MSKGDVSRIDNFHRKELLSKLLVLGRWGLGGEVQTRVPANMLYPSVRHFTLTRTLNTHGGTQGISQLTRKVNT